MDITLDELLENGRPLVVKGKEYFSSEAYITPFLERMQRYTDDFIVKVKQPDTMTKSLDTNNLDQGFSRVWVQAVLPESESVFDNHREVMNILYALDTRKPLVKIFRSNVNQACLNMCTFNPHALEVQELKAEEPINYRFIDTVMEMADDTKKRLIKMSNTYFDRDNVYDILGHWVDNCINLKWDRGFGKVKVEESLPINVYKSLFLDTKSDYYCPPEKVPTLFDVYNAFTYPISNDKGKDIVNKFEKICLISQIMGI